MPRGFRFFVQLTHFFGSQGAISAGGYIAEPQRSDCHAFQFNNFMSESSQDTADFAILAFA
jgi:hypothetical protein